jgi:hypothetical protein
MSKKTLHKRIALVALAALGAGLLTSTSASAANNAAVGGANAAPAAGILNIATTASTTGDAIVAVSNSVADVDDATAMRSRGLLANSTTLTTSSLTSTATVAASSELVFYAVSGSATASGDPITTFVVDGATITDRSTGESTTAFSEDLSTLSVGTEDVGGVLSAIAVTPKAGVTSYTVSMYTTTSTENSMTSTTCTNVSPYCVAIGGLSKGTLAQRYLVTVATASASGVYSAADSYVAAEAAATDNTTATVDATGALVSSSQTAPYVYININLRDAYDVSLDGGKGALIITGTNGAGIAYKADGTGATATSDFNLTQVSNTSAAGAITVTKPAARANKSFSTTITISWNGVVVATKAVTFLGEVASMTVTPRRIGALNAANADAFRVAYADDAGNALVGLGTTATTVVTSTLNTVVTGASIGTQGTTTDLAKGTLNCAAGTDAYRGGGTAKLQLRHVNAASGTSVLSNVFDATCQGDAYTYTASWDKASYTPGSIATLTISFKDRDGDLANGYDLVGNGGLITVTGGPSSTAVTIPANTDKPDSGTGLQGIKTYQFTVGTTEGDYVAVISVPDVNSANSAQGNISAAYSVKNATSAVTNAEVLAAIVKLIASINKQIRALQKSLRR